MKMEFGDEDAEAGDSQEMGLAARLTKKVKKEPKEKGSDGKGSMLHIKMSSCHPLVLSTCSHRAAKGCSFLLGSKSGKQTTLQFKPVEEKKKTATKKKKNPWSSDEESGEDYSGTPDSADDVAPKRRPARTGKCRVQHLEAITAPLSLRTHFNMYKTLACCTRVWWFPVI